MTWSLALAAIGIAGLYLAGKNNYWGWGIGLAAQLLWIIFALVTAQYGFILSALAYGFVYGKNFLDWKPKIKLGRETISVPTNINIKFEGTLTQAQMDAITQELTVVRSRGARG